MHCKLSIMNSVCKAMMWRTYICCVCLKLMDLKSTWMQWPYLCWVVPLCYDIERFLAFEQMMSLRMVWDKLDQRTVLGVGTDCHYISALTIHQGRCVVVIEVWSYWGRKFFRDGHISKACATIALMLYQIDKVSDLHRNVASTWWLKFCKETISSVCYRESNCHHHTHLTIFK